MAPPRRALATRARPRRGSVERPINARMVRGTWLLVALPLLLAAFSVARPQPLPAPALPPAFDAANAEQLTRELARDYPDRSPGSPGSLGAATWLRDQLTLYDFKLQEERFAAQIPGRGRVELVNIVAVVDGASQRKIVITAHRDNSGESQGANDNASGTAALVELARAYAPATGTTTVHTQPSHTLVFVSTDGGAFGALGAAHFAESSPYRDDAVAVISLDAIGGAGAPRLLIAGDTARSPAASLVRTASIRVLEQSGREPLRASALRQLLDLGFPFTLGEQGPFVARGIPAVTLTTVPEGGPSQALTDEGLSAARLGELGRATQNLVGSLDAGLELTQGTSSYVYLGSRIVRGWAIEFVLLTALLPFAIGAIDLFARCRRRRIPLAPAARSLRSRLLFWGYAGLLLFLAARLGAFPEGEPRPLPPGAGVYDPSPVVLGIVGALLVAGWLVARERLIPRRPATLEETLAGHTVALLALGLVALVLVSTNPFSLVYLLPSLYAWLWLPQAHAASPVVRVALLTLGLAGPLILMLSFATRFDLGGDALWYLLSLVAAGYVPWVAVLLGLAWLAVAAQLATLVSGRYSPYPDVRMRGPGSRPGALLDRLAASRARRRAPQKEPDALEG